MEHFRDSDHLLHDEHLSQGNDAISSTTKRSKPGLCLSSRLSIILLALSCLLNLLLATYIFRHELTPTSSTTDGQGVIIPSSTGLQYDLPSTYHHHSDYWGDNATRADELWDQLSTDPLVVAIPDSWAQQRGLPESARWPWDPTRGRYFIRAFHELHCLKYIRRYITDIQRGNPEALIGVHALHCLDSLRQGVMCRADDTLQPTSDDTTFAIGDREVVMCRNFDELSKWALSEERNACHRSLNDYKPIHHSIERYAFCPEGSKYEAIANAYFEEHGHQDPWGKI